jgi:hypothetical protein
MEERRRSEDEHDAGLLDTQQAYDDAVRSSREAQEALGRAEDELSAAEAGRDAAESAPRSEVEPGTAEDRLAAAEDLWDDRVRNAEHAAERRDQARVALDRSEDAGEDDSPTS